MKRTKAEQDGLLLLRLGAMFFVAIGFGVVVVQRSTMLDVRMAQASARCLIRGCDPYNADDVVRMYEAAGGPPPSRPRDLAILQFESRYLYLPTIFTFTSPIAPLPFKAFLGIWMCLVAGVFLIATVLVWDVAKRYSPLLTGALLGVYLANCGSVISSANAGSLTVSLCIISVWCFFVERFQIAGVLCLAASLAIKPHDSGLVWLCLIAMGGVSRKRALQSLLVYVGISLPVLIRISRIVPNWWQELHANLVLLSAHGAVSDPGPTTVFQRGALMVTNLQSALSLIWDNPNFYNAISYAICLLVLAGIAGVAIRFRPAGEKRWLAIASVAALSMLPVYHRLYDAKLLILMIPACAILWQKGGRIGKLSLLATAGALLVTAEIPWAIYVIAAAGWSANAGALRPLLIASIAVPIPLTLLLASVFYLVAYARTARDSRGDGDDISIPRVHDSNLKTV
jgi:hypothetical protein